MNRYKGCLPAKVLRVIANNGAPMSSRAISDAMGIPIAQILAVVRRLHTLGELIRDGSPRHYVYSLGASKDAKAD